MLEHFMSLFPSLLSSSVLLLVLIACLTDGDSNVASAIRKRSSSLVHTVSSDDDKSTTNNHFFEDNVSEPNEWKTFRMWSCNSPTSLSAFAAAFYDSSEVGGMGNISGMVLFGGRLFENGQDPLYGTWLYDLREKVWQQLKTRKKPQNRKGHVMQTLCHKTILLMGGRVTDLKTNRIRPVTDLWSITNKQGTWSWKQLMRDCQQDSCNKDRPLRIIDQTARVIAQPLSPCSCKESVILFQDEQSSTTVWELRCIKDEETYVWHKFSMKSMNKSEFELVSKLTASSGQDSVIYAVTTTGVWQYYHKPQSTLQTWTRVQQIGNSSGQNSANGWYRIKRLLALADHSLLSDNNQELVLFGRHLNRVLTFNLLSGKWKLEKAFGTPPVRQYYAFMVYSMIFIYGGTDSGGCRQRVWTLRRLSNDFVWLWTHMPQQAIEPHSVIMLSPVLLGSHVFMRSYESMPNSKKEMQLWDLDLNSMQWWIIKGNNQPKLYIARMTPSEDTSAIIATGISYEFETWMFLLNTRKWVRLNSPKELKEKRRDFYSFVQVRQTEFLLFGGYDHYPHRKVVSNDVWKYTLNVSNPQYSQWQLLLPSRHSSNRASSNSSYITPSPRTYHSVAVINSSMIVFGGRSESRECLHDLWSLNIDTLQWRLLTANDDGPQPTKRNFCYSSVLGVGPQLLVTTGCSHSSIERHPNDCSTGNLQQTWLYLPHLAKWSFVSWIRDINTRLGSAMFMYKNYVVLPDVEGRAKLHYISPQCPHGLASSNIKQFPCQRCPIGKFTTITRNKCEKCPRGLTTPTKGSFSIFNCSVCIPSVCIHGDCFVQQKDGRPFPVCNCMVGFMGTNCSLPTFYIIAATILLVAILIVCGTCGFLHFKKRKQQRERQLCHQVKELTSAWQVNVSELTIHNRIGSGGFGEVFMADYRDLTVAVKFLRTLADDSINREFEREIKFMQTIRHPNIVLFIGAGKQTSNEALPFLITEYMQRGSLRGILDQEEIHLDHLRRIKFAVDAACGMNFLHTQQPTRIHRDLKSDNLLVSSNWVVKVADFGLGRQLPSPSNPDTARRLTSASESSPLVGNEWKMTAKGIGAARWRAPELMKHSTKYGTAVDVYRYELFHTYTRIKTQL